MDIFASFTAFNEDMQKLLADGIPWLQALAITKDELYETAQDVWCEEFLDTLDRYELERE